MKHIIFNHNRSKDVTGTVCGRYNKTEKKLYLAGSSLPTKKYIKKRANRMALVRTARRPVLAISVATRLEAMEIFRQLYPTIMLIAMSDEAETLLATYPRNINVHKANLESILNPITEPIDKAQDDGIQYTGVELEANVVENDN